MNEKKP